MSPEHRRREIDRLTAIALALVLVPVLTAGCLVPDEETGPVTLVLRAPTVADRDTNAGTVWDASLSIQKVLPDDAGAEWTQVTVTIKDTSGSVLLPDTPVSKDSGLYGTAVEVWYDDDTGDAGTVDGGDGLKVTGMDRTYQGAMVIINQRGSVAATVELPIIF